MTDDEKLMGIFEVQAGGYINVKRKNVFIYTPQSTLFTNISKNFIGACTHPKWSLYDLCKPDMKNQVTQLKKDYFGFNLSRFYKFGIIKNNIAPNYYWFDNFRFHISVGFPILREYILRVTKKQKVF